MKEIDGIENLKNVTYSKLINIDGIGKVKAIELISLVELSYRMFLEKEKINIKINSSSLIYNNFKDLFYNKKAEEFYVLFLDSKGKLIDFKMLFKGTLNQSVVHPREVFKEAFNVSASSFVIIHNHPSGDATPSKEDIDFTYRILETSKIVGIKLLDHIIFGDNNYYSFFEQNICN